jgi:hypothetical protein
VIECRHCKELKPATAYIARKDRSGRLRPYCMSCMNDVERARYNTHKREQPFKLKTSRARVRSNALGLPFDLDPDYLESIWTGTCPVFGVEIYLWEKDRSDEFAAELDRFIPERGYTKGNVHFLSRRANRLKNNVTSKELQQLLDWMKQHESK